MVTAVTGKRLLAFCPFGLRQGRNRPQHRPHHCSTVMPPVFPNLGKFQLTVAQKTVIRRELLSEFCLSLILWYLPMLWHPPDLWYKSGHKKGPCEEESKHPRCETAKTVQTRLGMSWGVHNLPLQNKMPPKISSKMRAQKHGFLPCPGFRRTSYTSVHKMPETLRYVHEVLACWYASSQPQISAAVSTGRGCNKGLEGTRILSLFHFYSGNFPAWKVLIWHLYLARGLRFV